MVKDVKALESSLYLSVFSENTPHGGRVGDDCIYGILEMAIRFT